MTRKPYIKSSISALQNWGGYWRHAVVDNPLNRIYCTLSWLLAAASAFVSFDMPPICPLSPSEPHRKLIGTSSESHRRVSVGTQGDI